MAATSNISVDLTSKCFGDTMFISASLWYVGAWQMKLASLAVGGDRAYQNKELLFDFSLPAGQEQKFWAQGHGQRTVLFILEIRLMLKINAKMCQ